MTGARELLHKLLFTIVLTSTSRVLLGWDRLFGRLRRIRLAAKSEGNVSRISFPSGSSLIDATLVRPMNCPEDAGLLICHGIGETVEHWFGVQQLLAANGVASLVFDYSGYGRSSGLIGARRCEQDAVAAFTRLQELLPLLPISILGFSLGSGIAAAILHHVPVRRLVLCAAFTSFREAAWKVGFPASLGFLVPDLWRTIEALRCCSVPVLLVQGEKDQLFPVQMAIDLKNACALHADLVVVPKLSHADPYYHPELSYWGSIVSKFLLEKDR
ncbi:Bem46 protein [Acidisarcina polymorpha]|uniref:Bem46 protein n=1 Tax=Acidisarcina polymorpha TaxID=2211140 RepID=A0A2Z5G9B8_9BACT|nr:alpha/beta fold hydrolase [Acidisarcina polymorpha]AXC15284.1 Bem46 protein [Acidisarcina polymorpha]